MDRIEIEAKLGRDRAWLLEHLAAMPESERTRAATPSEHEPAQSWCALDHLAHLAGIERAFNAMIERHLAGDRNPVGLATNPDGSPRTRETVLAAVHAGNERFIEDHRGAPLAAVVALGQAARAETLALLARLSDEQLAAKLPGAPWADGTVGGVLAVNADHGRQHWRWLQDGLSR